MPLLRAQAELLSQNDVVVGLIEEIITVNDMFALLPFVGVNGRAFVYKRELTLPEFPAAGSPTFVDVSAVIPESAGTFTEVVTRLRILAGDVDVDKFLLETMSDTEDQLATQIALKMKAVGRRFMDVSVNGNNGTNALEFDGIRVLTTAGQTLNAGAAGAALTFGMLDQLCDMVPNTPDVLMMRQGTRRAYVNLLRTTGYGTDAVMMQLPNLSKPVLTVNGYPVIVNDFLPGNEVLGAGTNLASVYAVRMNELDGLHGLFGGASAGIRVENVGTVQNQDAIRTRVKWYCGLALKSTRSVARLAGVTNS